ncbi:MAG: extracellular solute-binding protein [Micromonosporaceae bacterium]|nr:extracellular solute-binding protein [Micromonosporaceae bacterium]
MSNRRATLAATAAIALAVSGCGGVGSDDSGDSVTLKTMGFGTGDEIAKVRVKAARKTIAPNQVKTSENAFDAQQFLSAVAAGSAPDLVYMDRQLIGTYATKGNLLPLTDCIADQKIDMDQYRAPAVKEVTLDGKAYGLPEFYSNRVVMINNSALKSAGLDPAAVDTSDWDTLAKVSEKLIKKSGGKLSRIGFDPKLPEFLPLWAKANGVSIISEDGTTANLDDPKLVEALEYAVSLIDEHGGWGKFKSFRDSFDFFGDKNQFATDQLGAFPMEDWYLTVLEDVSPDEEITVLPFTSVAGEPVDFVTGSAWAITADSKHKDEACEFIKTMTDSKTWVKAARAKAEARDSEGKPYVGTYTGNAVADEVIFGELVKPSGNAGLDNGVQVVLKAQESAFALPSSPAGAEFQKAWQDAVNRVLSGDQKPGKALAQAQQEAQKALDKAAEN